MGALTESEKIEVAQLIVALADAEMRLETAQAKSTGAAKEFGNAKIALDERIRALVDEAKADLRGAGATPQDDLPGAGPDA